MNEGITQVNPSGKACYGNYIRYVDLHKLTSLDYFEEALKYQSVGCFHRPMGVPNPSARTYSVQTGGSAPKGCLRRKALFDIELSCCFHQRLTKRIYIETTVVCISEMNYTQRS